MRQHDAGRGAADPGHAVMFGHPVAREPRGFAMSGDVGGIRQRGANRAAFVDGDKVEKG